MKPLPIAALALALTTSSHAASRARYGGTLRVAVAAEKAETDPLLADAPADAALLSMTTRPVCWLEGRHRLRPTVAAEISRLGETRLVVSIRQGQTFAAGAAITARDIVSSWSRATRPEAATPYRALLFPVRGEGRHISAGASQRTIELRLSFPWPDLSTSLCHPALGILPASGQGAAGLGPFMPTGPSGTYQANLAFPAGRPFADRLALSFGDERVAARLLALKQAQVALGIGGEHPSSAPALYATYLVFSPAKAGAEFRQAFESVVDRGDLSHFFVRSPSAPMFALLPPSLMPQEAAPRPATPAIGAPRELSLAFDQSLPEQRSVAERIQVKLHELKYRIALRPLPRSQLRALWASGAYDLMLHALLLPPSPAAALSLAIEGAGRHDLLAAELPPLGAIANDSERDAAARERAKALVSSLPSIPLYAQALSAIGSEEVKGLHPDAQGLPALDDAFLATEGPR